jgi:hypothetical protein
LPIFEMRPSFCLPPEEFCLGVSPRKAANSRTQLLNALRGHLTEVGVIAAQGPRHGRELAKNCRILTLF